MIIPERVQCDICKATKEESSAWMVSLESVAQSGLHITFGASREMFRDPHTGELPPDAAFSDICSQECAHTQFSRWLESHRDLIRKSNGAATSTASSESESA